MSFDQIIKRIDYKLTGISHKLDYDLGFLNNQDLRQEALLRLWQDFEAGKLADKNDSYILQGCCYHLKNYLRTVRPRRPHLSLDTCIHEDGEALQQTIDFCDQGSVGYRQQLSDRLLAETIRSNGFSTREKEVLGYCSQGLTMRQIGTRIGVSHVAVVKMMARIREKSRQYIDPE